MTAPAPRAETSGGPEPAAPPPGRSPEPWGYALGVGATLLAFYAATLARGPTFTDGPEITTAIDRLGVIHPTGYPIFTVLAHLFTRVVPLPTLYGVELFNALAGVGASVAVMWTVRELWLGTTARGRDRGARSTAELDAAIEALPEAAKKSARFGGALAGLLLGLCPLLWAQVRIPEVYAFHVLLVSVALALWARFELTRDARFVLAAAVPMGMGLAHHVTMVYMLPAALLLLLWRKPGFFVAWLVTPVARGVRLVRPGFLAGLDERHAWGFPVACLLGALPIASYGYLIWANAHTDGVPWGDVNDWSRVYDHMTGKQYQRFVGSGEVESFLRRLWKLPALFDQQYLAFGAVLFGAGIVAVARRSGAYALFALAYLAFNVAHAVGYGVGDYANYYLPAFVVAAQLIGLGAATVHDRLSRASALARYWATLSLVLVWLPAHAAIVRYLGTATRRIQPWLVPYLDALVVAPAAVATALVAGYALHRRFVARRPPPAPSAAFSTGVLSALLALALLPAAALRAHSYTTQPVIGASYGEELTSTLPRGAVLMTQGDGYLFTMWYEHHVLGRGIHTATLDMGNLRTPWYQRYLRGRYPESCDPVGRSHFDDPLGYEASCGSFRRRMEHGAAQTWTSLGLERGPAHRRPPQDPAPIVRGLEAACSDPAKRAALGKACRCWGYGQRTGIVEEHCVHSAEDGGAAPRDDLEIHAHRIVEDEIDHRPVFERNVFTFWMNGHDSNPRGWRGPAYLRPSGRYDLLNRGRANQVVYHDDLAPHADACDRAEGAPVELRPTEPKPGGARKTPRERYVPNGRATLLKASYLRREPDGNDDDATRVFAPGDRVHVALDWFERYHYDAKAPNKRGQEIREGVRACAFAPDGARVGVAHVVTGEALRDPLVALGADAPEGSYLVQACSVGPVGEAAPPFEGLPCQRLLLEYRFTVTR